MKRKKTPTARELVAMPLDATRAEEAAVMAGHKSDPDEVETTPGIPRSALKRRRNSEQTQRARVELVALQIQDCPDDVDAIREYIAEGQRKALYQGRTEMSKELAEARAELQLESARRSECELEAITQSRLRAQAEARSAEIRALLIRVRDGEISPEEIPL